MEINKPKNDQRTPQEFLEALGYVFQGNLEDKHRKRHMIFSKDGQEFEFKGSDISGKEIDVIKLVPYS